MGGKATNQGTDFQARVAAYLAAHLLANERLVGWSDAPWSVPATILLEQETAGDDIRVELADGGILEVQAKHGLRATSRLEDALDRFAAKLQEDEQAVIAIDRATSSDTVQNELRNLLEQWRDGRTDLKPSEGLGRKIEILLDPANQRLKERLRIAALDVDDDYLDGARYAVKLLRGLLVRPDDAEAAWSVLIQDAQYAAKKGGRRDRAGYRRVLLEKGIHLQELDRAVIGGIATTLASRSGVDLDAETELEPVAKLLRVYQPHAALALLDAEEHQSVRALHLRGVAMMLLGRLEEGRGALRRALELEPTRTAAMVHLAMAEHAAGNQQRAAELLVQATASDCVVPTSWAARLHLAKDITLADVPEDLRQHPEVLTAAAILDMESGRGREAVTKVRAALEAGKEPSRLLHLAQALRIQASEEPVGLQQQLLEESLRTLDEADALLSDKTTETAKGALWGRALTLESLERHREALDVYQHLAALGRLSWESAARFATLSIAAGYRQQDALAALAEVETSDELGSLSLTAHLLAALGHEAEAHESLLAASGLALDHAPPESRIAFALAGLDLGEPELVKQALASLEQGDVRVLVLGARAAIQLGDHDEAERIFDNALSVATSAAESGIRVEFGSYLGRRGEYQRVVELLGPLDEGQDVRLAFLKAEALYNTGDLAASYQIVSRVCDLPDEPTWALRLGTNIALRRHDFAGAASWLDRWLAREPQALEAVLWRSQLYLRAGDQASAAVLLSSQSFEDETAYLRMRRAWLLLQVGRVGESLDLALEVLRSAVDDAQLQYSYFLIAATIGDRQPTDSQDVVAVGSFVVLRDSDREHWEYVLVEDDPVASFDEISVDDPLAQRLLGKTCGATVRLRDVHPPRDATVVEIAGPHTHAVRWTASRQEKQDPVSPRVWSMPIPSTDEGSDFSSIYRVVEEKAARESKILDAIQEKVLPLGFAEKHLGHSTIQVYGALCNDIDRRLPVEFVDLTAGLAAARLGRFVLTRSALITIEALDCFDLIESLGPEVLLPPSLIDMLRQEEAESKEVARRGRTALGWNDGQPTLFETTPSDGVAFLASLQRLVAWVERVGTVRPRPFDWESRQDEIWENVAEASFDAGIIAADQEAPLFADDLGLRRLAHHKLGVQGFSTYALLTAAREDGHLDEARYEKLLTHLLVLGHSYVPPTVQTVRVAMRDETGWPSHALARILVHLRGRHVNLSGAARFVARVIRMAILEHPVRDFHPIADLAFESIFHGRTPDEVEALLRRALEIEFLLLPQRERVLEDLAAFRAFRVDGVSPLWTR